MSYIICFHKFGFSDGILRSLLLSGLDLRVVWGEYTKYDLELQIPEIRKSKLLSVWEGRDLNLFEKLTEQLHKLGMGYIVLGSSEYPYLLSHIFDPPPVLYYKGDLGALNCLKNLAVIGSRNMTDYGKRCIDRLLPDIVSQGIGIVSGLALGVDGYAHFVTCKNKGTPIGVLGCGLDIIYPPSNRQIYKDVLDSGGIILSPFILGTEPLHYNFPMRNRVISGLSHAVLVVEAAIKSGSIITAKLALEHNRDVMVIPGDIFREYSSGTNELWKEGAIPVFQASDILNILGISASQKKCIIHDLEGDHLIVFNILRDPRSIDEVIYASGLSFDVVQEILLSLEMDGYIERSGANFIQKVI